MRSIADLTVVCASDAATCVGSAAALFGRPSGRDVHPVGRGRDPQVDDTDVPEIRFGESIRVRARVPTP